MNGDDDKTPPPEGDRTVFMPMPGTIPPQPAPDSPPESVPVPPAAPQADDAPADAPAAAEPEAPPPAAPTTPPPATAAPAGETGLGIGSAGTLGFGGTAAPVAPLAPGEARQIQIGDVLNHIFEVRRFIGRGGMGEVFEGINVNTDERVAIKVILPHLAADPSVQAMFRKEARTLTRLSHPGLVQYRVLAQEPQLGALYIVTEFIEGANLSDQLADLKPSAADLTKLLRRLAEGLKAAHALGAIHRDISPDNVMLEGGKLGSAKVIDFGIAKDLDGAGQTIVGDGFAGKLNYVAPEQLGDYGREIGPWTDVYSLGLTMMAVALGRDVHMGATLVEAVDKRRAGIDVSAAPEVLQPLLQRMLAANPAERLRSMDEVLQVLDNPELAALSNVATEFSPGALGGGSPGVGARKPAVIGGAVAAVLAVVLGAGYYFTAGSKGGAANDADLPLDQVEAGPPPADPMAAARKAIDSQLHSIPCSWLDVSNLEASGTSVTLSLYGVSGGSALALERLERVLKRAGLTAASIDAADVSPIPANFCKAVEAFNQIRNEGPGRLQVAQRKFEMGVLPPAAGADAGKLGGQAVFTLDLKGLTEEMTLVGLEETGVMQQMAPNKSVVAQNSEPMGNDSYRFTLNTTHSGWSGILMVTGKAPFAGDLLTHGGGPLAPNWSERFLQLAKERNWKTEMVWYKTVDEVAN